MRDQQIIKYYRIRQWGVEREFVHPDCNGQAAILTTLTGRSTITPAIRELCRDLSQGQIIWQEVIAP